MGLKKYHLSNTKLLMMERLPQHVLLNLCENVSVYQIKKLACVNHTLNTQITEILQKIRYLSVNGDHFHDKIFFKPPKENTPIFFTKILKISKYQFCTGYVRFYNFHEPEFKYRYEFHNHQTEKIGRHSWPKQKGVAVNSKTFLEYPLTINSLVIKKTNVVVVKLKIFWPDLPSPPSPRQIFYDCINSYYVQSKHIIE